MNPKYIVFEEIYDYPCIIDIPMIIFPASINHSTIARKIGYKPISAGFLNMKKEKCFGESISLNIKSNPEIDTKLFKIQFQNFFHEKLKEIKGE